MIWWRIVRAHTRMHRKAAGTIWKTLFHAPTRLRWASAPNDPAWARFERAETERAQHTLRNGQSARPAHVTLNEPGLF